MGEPKDDISVTTYGLMSDSTASLSSGHDFRSKTFGSSHLQMDKIFPYQCGLFLTGVFDYNIGVFLIDWYWCRDKTCEIINGYRKACYEIVRVPLTLFCTITVLSPACSVSRTPREWSSLITWRSVAFTVGEAALCISRVADEDVS